MFILSRARSSFFDSSILFFYSRLFRFDCELDSELDEETAELPEWAWFALFSSSIDVDRIRFALVVAGLDEIGGGLGLVGGPPLINTCLIFYWDWERERWNWGHLLDILELRRELLRGMADKRPMPCKKYCKLTASRSGLSLSTDEMLSSSRNGELTMRSGVLRLFSWNAL